MKIKHSKFKNTGLIYELLVKQVTSDLVARKNSPAVDILRKYYAGDSALVQEHKLYKTIVDGINLTTIKADNLIGESLKAAKKINQKDLRELKYNLISEIKENYDLEDFFSTPVTEYKTLAAFYCLMEADRSSDLIDPNSIVNNKVTLLEHMTSRFQDKEDVTNSLIKEFSSQEKDLRLLTFKILLEKFNNKYADLLPEQKNVLKNFISIGSLRNLREYVNAEMSKISEQLVEVSKSLPRGIERIKINEALKLLEPIPNTAKVMDEHLVRVLQFYDLINEIKKA